MSAEEFEEWERRTAERFEVVQIVCASAFAVFMAGCVLWLLL